MNNSQRIIIGRLEKLAQIKIGTDPGTENFNYYLLMDITAAFQEVFEGLNKLEEKIEARN
jgi:hypothetical protein